MNISDSSHLYLSILQKIKDAIIATSPTGELLFFNKAAESLIGISSGTDKAFWTEQFELLKPGSKTIIEKKNHPLQRALRDERIVNEEYILQPKKKITNSVIISSHTIINDGKKEGIVLVFQDISKEKETEKKLNSRSKSLMEAYEGLRRAEAGLKMTNSNLEKRVLERTHHLTRMNKELQSEIQTRLKVEQQIKKTNERLLKTNNDLDNFVYTASHDLKAPIANIEGLINALKEESGCNKDLSSNLINLISISVEKFKTTISDLTEISKVQKGGDDFVEELIIEDIFKDTQVNIQELILASKAKIHVDFTKCPSIRFARKNLRSIFYNLLSNAIKYAHPDRAPEIMVSSDCDSSYIKLRVVDNGMGIAAAKQSQIFSMFKRFHDHVEGSGIGLYIVKRIVENAGGKIELVSTVGEGTDFLLTIPNE